MNAQATITPNDYKAIAAQIVNHCDGYDRTQYTVEVMTANGVTLFIDVDYTAEYRDEIGGSYEGYDFERISVLDSENFEVTGFDAYDKDGESTSTDFNESELLTYLN